MRLGQIPWEGPAGGRGASDPGLELMTSGLGGHAGPRAEPEHAGRMGHGCPADLAGQTEAERPVTAREHRCGDMAVGGARHCSLSRWAGTSGNIFQGLHPSTPTPTGCARLDVNAWAPSCAGSVTPCAPRVLRPEAQTWGGPAEVGVGGCGGGEAAWVLAEPPTPTPGHSGTCLQPSGLCWPWGEGRRL